MRSLWLSIERWGPFAVALIAILALIGYGWGNDQRIARLEGVAYSLQHQLDAKTAHEVALRQDVATLRNWIIATYERGSAHEWNLPPLPESTKKESTTDGNQKAPVQRPR